MKKVMKKILKPLPQHVEEFVEMLDSQLGFSQETVEKFKSDIAVEQGSASHVIKRGGYGVFRAEAKIALLSRMKRAVVNALNEEDGDMGWFLHYFDDTFEDMLMRPYGGSKSICELTNIIRGEELEAWKEVWKMYKSFRRNVLLLVPTY